MAKLLSNKDKVKLIGLSLSLNLSMANLVQATITLTGGTTYPTQTTFSSTNPIVTTGSGTVLGPAPSVFIAGTTALDPGTNLSIINATGVTLSNTTSDLINLQSPNAITGKILTLNNSAVGSLLTGNIRVNNNTIDFIGNDISTTPTVSNFTGILSGAGSAALSILGNLNLTSATNLVGFNAISVAPTLTLNMTAPIAINPGSSFTTSQSGTLASQGTLFLGQSGVGNVNITQGGVATASTNYMDMTAVSGENSISLTVPVGGSILGNIVTGTNDLNYIGNDVATTPTLSQLTGTSKLMGGGNFKLYVNGTLNLLNTLSGFNLVELSPNATLTLNNSLTAISPITMTSSANYLTDNTTVNFNGPQSITAVDLIGYISTVNITNATGSCVFSPTNGLPIGPIGHFNVTSGSSLTLNGGSQGLGVYTAINLSGGSVLNLNGTAGAPVTIGGTGGINAPTGSTINAGSTSNSNVIIQGSIQLGGLLNLNGVNLSSALIGTTGSVVSVLGTSNITYPMSGLTTFNVLGNASNLTASVTSAVGTATTNIDTGTLAAGSSVQTQLQINASGSLGGAVNLYSRNATNNTSVLIVNGGTLSATVISDADSLIQLQSGTISGPITLNSGAALPATGGLQMTGGTLSGSLTANYGSLLTVSNGTLSGPVSLGTTLTWSGGSITNTITGQSAPAVPGLLIAGDALSLNYPMSAVPSLTIQTGNHFTINALITNLDTLSVPSGATLTLGVSSNIAMDVGQSLALGGILNSNTVNFNTPITGSPGSVINYQSAQPISLPVTNVPTIVVTSALSPGVQVNAAISGFTSGMTVSSGAYVEVNTSGSLSSGSGLTLNGGNFTLNGGTVSVPVSANSNAAISIVAGTQSSAMTLSGSSLNFSGGTLSGQLSLTNTSTATLTGGTLGLIEGGVTGTSNLNINNQTSFGAINSLGGHLNAITIQALTGTPAYTINLSSELQNAQTLTLGTNITLNCQTGAIVQNVTTFNLNGTLNISSPTVILSSAVTGGTTSVMNVQAYDIPANPGIILTNKISPATLNIGGSLAPFGDVYKLSTNSDIGTSTHPSTVNLSANSSLTLSGGTLYGSVTGSSSTSIVNLNTPLTLTQAMSNVTLNVTGANLTLAKPLTNLYGLTATNATLTDSIGLSQISLSGTNILHLLGTSTLSLSPNTTQINLGINDPTQPEATFALSSLVTQANANIVTNAPVAVGHINLVGTSTLTNYAPITACSNFAINNNAKFFMNNTVGKAGGVVANLVNQGNLFLSSPQTLNGSYSGSGTINFVVTDATNFGSLNVVGGTFGVGTQLNLVLNNYTVIPSQATFSLITVGNSTNLQTLNLQIVEPSNIPPIYQFTQNVTPSTFEVTLLHPSYAAYVTQASVAPLAVILDQIRVQSLTNTVGSLLYALDNLSNPSAVSLALQQLSPRSHGGAIYASQQLPQAAFNRIGERMATLRVAKYESRGYSAGDIIFDDETISNNPGAFVPLFFYNRTHNPTTATENGFTSRSLGLGLMRDVELNENYVLGGGLSYANSHINATGNMPETIRIHSAQAMLYGSFERNHYFTEIQGATTRSQFHSFRPIPFFNSTALGTYNGSQYSLQAKTGYLWSVGNLSLSPQLSAQWGHTQQGAYYERGAGVGNLIVEQVDSQTIQVGYGATASLRFPSHWGRGRLSAKAMRYRDIKNTQPNWQSSLFAGGPSFLVSGTPLSKNSHSLSVNAEWSLKTHITLSVDYEWMKRSALKSQQAFFKVRWNM